MKILGCRAGLEAPTPHRRHPATVEPFSSQSLSQDKEIGGGEWQRREYHEKSVGIVWAFPKEGVRIFQELNGAIRVKN